MSWMIALLLAATPVFRPVRPSARPPVDTSTFVLRDFRFAGGETMPEVRIHYRTLGHLRIRPGGEARNAVMILPGAGGLGQGFLNPAYAGELFAPGQPLDTTQFFIIIPDNVGHGRSSKPSDGMHARFPHYAYDDMVTLQYRLLTEGLHVNHLALIMGTSMGCMHSWLWLERYPDFMDGAVPLACLPTRIAGREGMRRTLTIDADDSAYAVDASRDYDPSGALARITAPVLAINSADDGMNPPEPGIMEQLMPGVRHGRYVLLPVSAATRGHGTHSLPAAWKSYLVNFLAEIRGDARE